MTTDKPFRYRLRVRFHECDGQKVVFNARYGEYVDVAALEFSRAIFGAVTTQTGGIDWRLVKQEMQWKAPAVFDDVLEVSVHTAAVGRTSFTWISEIALTTTGAVLAQASTVYVLFDTENNTKAPISDAVRSILETGAPNIMVDCSGSINQYHRPPENKKASTLG